MKKNECQNVVGLNNSRLMILLPICVILIIKLYKDATDITVILIYIYFKMHVYIKEPRKAVTVTRRAGATVRRTTFVSAG